MVQKVQKKWLAILCCLIFTGSVSGIENTSDEELERGITLLKENKTEDAEKVFLSLSKENVADAYHYLGCIYIQKKNDLAKGVMYHKQASELGNLNSRFIYATALSEGYGCKQNIPLAIKLFKDIALQTEYPPAYYHAGRLMFILDPSPKEDHESINFLKKAASPNENASEPKGIKIAQLLLGVYYMERKNSEKAYFYLEAAAEQQVPEAWRKLGVMYSSGMGISKPDFEWAKLCFLAEERLTHSGKAAYNIGIIEGNLGNLEEALKWMKIAEKRKFTDATVFLNDKEEHKRIISLKKEKKKQKNLLQKNYDNYFNAVNKMMGTDARKVIEEVRELPNINKNLKMVRLPQPEKIRMSGWIYDPEALEQELGEKLWTGRLGFKQFITEQFKNEPLQKNLIPPNPTIRKINAAYVESLEKALEKSIFKKLSKTESENLIKLIDPEQINEQAENKTWKLNNCLYFNIFSDFSGNWQVRYYQFFMKIKDETFFIAQFGTPPTPEDADMILGVSQFNDDCINNLGVKYAMGEMDIVTRNDSEAEKFFKKTETNKHAVGTYNLAIFYQERGKKDLAEKYFNLAKEYSKEKKK